MHKIAVDAVLLPEEKVTNYAIELNKILVSQHGPEIVLNKNDTLPHISLAMGCIDKNNIEKIEDTLKQIANKIPPGKLTILSIVNSENTAGQTVSSLQIENTDALRNLHENVMNKMSPYFSADVAKDMLAEEDVSDSTLLWIKNYRQKSSYEKFFPHITIGYGKPDSEISARQFNAEYLSVCHLGNHCTCKKILASIKL